MRATTVMAAAAALLAGAVGAQSLASQAAPPSPPAAEPPAPDVTACQACHGANGISANTRVPNIAGQQPDYLIAQLQAFRGRTRPSSTMQAVAAQLSDEQIAALARYWSSRPAAVAQAPAAAASAPAIPSRAGFPAGFPAGFTQYDTATNQGTINERYANEVALVAARAGRSLPDGSIIVSVNRTAQTGAIASYAVMESRAGWGAAVPALLRNANWDFALFDPQRIRNDRLNQASCLACHRPQEANSFVFSFPALRAHATRAN